MKPKVLIIIFTWCLFLLLGKQVESGASADYGTVPGTPAIGQVNWLAWLDKNIQAGGYPSEVLTEDSTSPGTGVDQGYQDFGGAPNPKWILQVANFNDESNGDAVSILLGGIGASSGSIWQESFNWTDGVPFSDQGEATVGTGSSCPTMSTGSTGPTINWTASAGTYYIYRSQQVSGASNGASNGRYQYLATVTTAGAAGTYTDGSAGSGTDNWYIVVPADAGTGAINGCHSEEEGPLAIELATFTAISQPDHVLVDWATVAEQDNLGFNVLRSTSAEGAQVAINPELISSQAPGSGQGASYSFEDSDVEDGTTYYYWLQDVDTAGTTGLHGPVSVTYESSATAVDVSTLGTESRWGEPWTNGLLGTLLLAAAGYVWHRRRRV